MRLRSSIAPDGASTASRRGAEPRVRRALGEDLGLTADQQRAVSQRQAETGQLFGDTAVELGFVSEDRLRRAIEQHHGFSVLSDGDERVDPLVVTAFDPEDELARSARNLRGIVTAATRRDGQPVRTVALLGLDAVAELPVLAANLAVACAQTGITTLLIDAEIDDPHQHALFRSRNRLGLSTLLSNSQDSGLLQPVAIDGLSVLTSGPKVPNAPELFDRQRLAHVAESFAEDFDLVLVDAGCAATAVSASLGFDASIVVLRRGLTPVRQLRLLVEQLETSGQFVLGTVIVD